MSFEPWRLGYAQVVSFLGVIKLMVPSINLNVQSAGLPFCPERRRGVGLRRKQTALNNTNSTTVETPSKMEHWKILILDNPRHGVQQLHDALDADHTLIWAHTIAQAMEEIGDLKSDLDFVICGVHLENESMLDFLRAVKGEGRNERLPFICFRSVGSTIAEVFDAQIKLTSQLLGADGYIAQSKEGSSTVSLVAQLESTLIPIFAKYRVSADAQD